MEEDARTLALRIFQLLVQDPKVRKDLKLPLPRPRIRATMRSAAGLIPLTQFLSELYVDRVALPPWPDGTLLVLQDYLLSEELIEPFCKIALRFVRVMANYEESWPAPASWNGTAAQLTQTRELAKAALKSWDEWPLRDALCAIVGPEIGAACDDLMRTRPGPKNLRPDGLSEVLEIAALADPDGRLIQPELASWSQGPEQSKTRFQGWTVTPFDQGLFELPTAANPQLPPSGLPDPFHRAYAMLLVGFPPTSQYRLGTTGGAKRLEKDRRRAEASLRERRRFWVEEMAHAILDFLETPTWRRASGFGIPGLDFIVQVDNSYQNYPYPPGYIPDLGQHKLKGTGITPTFPLSGTAWAAFDQRKRELQQDLDEVERIARDVLGVGGAVSAILQVDRAKVGPSATEYLGAVAYSGVTLPADLHTPFKRLIDSFILNLLEFRLRDWTAEVRRALEEGGHVEPKVPEGSAP